MFSTLCKIEVDVSHLVVAYRAPKRRRLNTGCYIVNFDVVLLVGGVELKVLLAWDENVRFCWPLTM